MASLVVFCGVGVRVLPISFPDFWWFMHYRLVVKEQEYEGFVMTSEVISYIKDLFKTKTWFAPPTRDSEAIVFIPDHFKYEMRMRGFAEFLIDLVLNTQKSLKIKMIKDALVLITPRNVQEIHKDYMLIHHKPTDTFDLFPIKYIEDTFDMYPEKPSNLIWGSST